MDAGKNQQPDRIRSLGGAITGRLRDLLYKLREDVNRVSSDMKSMKPALEFSLDRQKEIKSIRFAFRSLLNKDVVVLTEVGSVAGKLLYVGDDFIQIKETSMELVYIPLQSIVAW